MGVAKACWVNAISANLAFFHSKNSGNQKHHVCWLTWQRRSISSSLICGLLLFAFGLVSIFTGHLACNLEWGYSQRHTKRSLPSKSSWGRHVPVADIWKSRFAQFYYQCSERGPHFVSPVGDHSSNGYLLIAASGGLNQQRIGIIDAVIVARILNATLVVPELDHHSFWKDDSDFVNIFDIDWFITSLKMDVTIVKRVPDRVMRSLERSPYTMRVPRKSNPDYYLDQVLPILVRRHVVQLTKFDYRLSNSIDEELQKLRCRVNYHALRFTRPLKEFGQRLVMEMHNMSKRYIAIHLRFEPDMLAFSGCYYGGGEKERIELAEIRKRWPTLSGLIPDDERKRGKCPLTPHEVGLMLRGLGFKNDSHIYVASGEIYGGEETLRPLRELFPNLYTKEMLATEDLKLFLPFSSQLAAIDYIVCDESDVFVTNNNGNMAKILAGRRRYGGHKRTIRPNSKKLSDLFLARHQMDWNTFAKRVKSCQRDFMGEPDEIRSGRGEFYEFPSSCICEKPFKNPDDYDETPRIQYLSNNG